VRFKDPGVAALFSAYPRDVRKRLLSLRKLIFDVAKRTPGVGPLEETLKWGQPSYLTSQSGSGSTIRIDRLKKDENGCAVYFHCQTTLVDSFKERYRDEFEFEGNRALLFRAGRKIPMKALGHCISMALTYRRDKKKSRDHDL